jgi:LuxR family maltose regulon positive regulatory protein
MEALNRGLQRKLLLISAPAGSGKTTLVSEWAHLQQNQPTPRPIAWLTLDGGDNDPARFAAYLIAALQAIDVSLGHTALAMLHSPQVEGLQPPLENVLALLINDLSARSRPITLVLDDYHLIDNPTIYDAVTLLVDNLPAQSQLIIIGREDPMLPLHRLRASDSISEIRIRDLRFTEEEATLLLNQTMGLDLDPDDIATLEHRTEGWAAGLQLAALSMQALVDRKEFIATFAGDDRYIVDYLLGEVLERQPSDIQSFLYGTSILNRLCGPLCDEVTGRSDSLSLLIHLEQGNLFLVPLDNKREWYRYHQLFGDLLRHRLRATIDPAGVARLHQRAAAWHENAGLLDEAIHHYLAGDQLDRAADIIESICAELITHSRTQEFLKLVTALPEEKVRQRPWLSVNYIWMLRMLGQMDLAATRLKELEEILPTSPPELAHRVQGQIATIRSYDAHNQGDYRSAVELLQRALQYLPAARKRERGMAQGNLGVNYLNLGNLQLARKAFRSAGDQGGRSWLVIAARSYLGDTYLLAGDLDRAADLYREAIALSTDTDGETLLPAAGHGLAGLGRVLYERGQLDQAREHLRQAVEMGELAGFWGITLRSIGPLLWAEMVSGDFAGAQALLGRALALARQVRESQGSGQWYPIMQAHQARTWLVQEVPDLESAVHWADTYERSKPDVSTYAEEFSQLNLVRVRLAQRQVDWALDRLAALAESAAAAGRSDSLIKILIIQASALDATGASDQASAALDRALELGAPQGYYRSFLDEGQPTIQLLRHSDHPYAERLLKRVSEAGAPLPDTAGESPPHSLDEPLNEREVTILRLFAAGLTNAQVAQEMFLSVNTIKWYAKNIYQKLDVGRRAQAVAKAKELGLIP